MLRWMEALKLSWVRRGSSRQCIELIKKNAHGVHMGSNGAVTEHCAWLMGLTILIKFSIASKPFSKCEEFY